MAVSKDGIHWQRQNSGKPVLTPGPSGHLDDGQVMGPEVLYDSGRSMFLMWYTGQPVVRHSSGIGYYRIFLATSKDGMNWKRANKAEPVLNLGPAGSKDEVQAATPSILREGDVFLMWYAAWAPEPNHTICIAESRDGIRWEKLNNGKPVEGLNPSVAYAPAVCKVGNQYLMLYEALHAKPELYGAVSKDGVHWQMIRDGKPVIPLGEGDCFDNSVVTHAYLLPVGDRILLWYTGFRRESHATLSWRVRIGLAEASLKGFR